MKTSYHSEHFTLYTLAEGVYAAIAKEGGASYSNAGLIDLGNRTLVFDAFETQTAARDLLDAAIQLTNHNPDTVIISHWHDDHWGGLQVFSDCAILSTPLTRLEMDGLAEEMRQDKQDPSGYEEYLRETENRLSAESDPQQRSILASTISRIQYTLQDLATLEPTLPNQTFVGGVSFQGSQRSAELISMGSGHTVSDCILRLPSERVSFIGDLGFFQSQPFMVYGDPPGWLARLEEMAGWEVEVFVPGHGPVGSKEDLELEAAYIRAIEELVFRVHNEGGSEEDALKQKLPPPFDSWQAIGQRFEANIRSSFKRQSGQ